MQEACVTFLVVAPHPFDGLKSFSEARWSFPSLPGTDAVAINYLLPDVVSCTQKVILMIGATLIYNSHKEQYRLECN